MAIRSSMFALSCSILVACSSSRADESSDEVQSESETLADTTAESGTDGWWTSEGDERAPYVDSWELVDEGSPADLRLLVIGGHTVADNFANHGDVEVVYDPLATLVRVEMQRFTIATSPEAADEAFHRMHYWGYDAEQPTPRDPGDPEDAALRCFLPDNAACYVRNYYEGMAQPIRDGVNFRVTIPAGWHGELRVITSDNLGDGVETYPDRSDVRIDGLAGRLALELGSGEAEIRVDASVEHYAGCPDNDACELGGFDPACGCVEPTSISVTGSAANVTIDLPTQSLVSGEDRWYAVQLANEAPLVEPICSATIDCTPFGAGCVIDPDFAAIEGKEVAEIDYPGAPASMGGGIRVTATTEACADVVYLDDPLDYDLGSWPVETRGDLLVCSGCL